MVAVTRTESSRARTPGPRHAVPRAHIPLLLPADHARFLLFAAEATGPNLAPRRFARLLCLLAVLGPRRPLSFDRLQLLHCQSHPVSEARQARAIGRRRRGQPPRPRVL